MDILSIAVHRMKQRSSNIYYLRPNKYLPTGNHPSRTSLLCFKVEFDMHHDRLINTYIPSCGHEQNNEKVLYLNTLNVY